MDTGAATLSRVIPREVEGLAVEVMTLACDRGVTVATAESCTGGLLAGLLTDIEGCSHAFDSGFVAYSDSAKAELLGVDQGILERFGAVSSRAAAAMACGALAVSRADLAISITGYADPPSSGDEAGLVFFGFARRGQLAEAEEHRFGNIGRGAVRLACLRVGLQILRRELMTA